MKPEKLLELSLRLIHGKRAVGIEAQAKTPQGRARHLHEAMADMRRAAAGLDTTNQHKAMVVDELDYIAARIDAKPQPSWVLVYGLLRLNMRLLGFNDLRGGQGLTPHYRKNETGD